MKAITQMENIFLLNIKNIAEENSYVIDVYDDIVTIIITNQFNFLSLHILNLFGSIGIKFKIVTGYKNNKLFEIQISLTNDELKKVNQFLSK